LVSISCTIYIYFVQIGAGNRVKQELRKPMTPHMCVYPTKNYWQWSSSGAFQLRVINWPYNNKKESILSSINNVIIIHRDINVVGSITARGPIWFLVESIKYYIFSIPYHNVFRYSYEKEKFVSKPERTNTVCGRAR